MKTKHTPGPFAFINSGLIDCIYSGDNRIAELIGPNSHTNGPLFAAAPELLEALDDCITNENATCIVQNDVAYMIRRLKAINQICRAAINKAIGEVS